MTFVSRANNTDIEKNILNDKKNKLVSAFFKNDVRSYLKKLDLLNNKIQKNVIPLTVAYRNLLTYTKLILKKIRIVDKVITEKFVLSQIKNLFRDKIKHYIKSSAIPNRSSQKPFGYPGDFKTIEMFYNNEPLSKGIGFCGDKLLLQDDYVKVVRIRKDITKSILNNFIRTSKAKSLDILNLGCGSCRELRELFLENNFNKNITFKLVDWEKEALKFSKKSLGEHLRLKNIKFIFLQENVLAVYKHYNKYRKIFKKQDLIYSIGLADYLPDIILGEIIKFLFILLKRNGKLIIAHKNVKIHRSLVSDWFCNWYFYPRDINDMRQMIYEYLKGKQFKIRINQIKSRHLFFITITKR